MSKAVMRQSLELLERYRKETPLGHQPHMIADVADKTITALRAALAEPEQPHTLTCVCGAEWDIHADGREELAVAPTPRKPLTRKELWAILASEQAYDKSGLDVFYRDQVIHLIRKAEAAHGIKEQEHE